MGRAASCIPTHRLSNSELSRALNPADNLSRTFSILSLIGVTCDGGSEATSPHVNHLPSELLVEIFEHYVETQCADILDRNNGIWLLTKICSRWRSLALSVPTLWSLIVIKLWTTTVPGTYPDLLPVVTHFLTRSRNCPLSIRLVTQSNTHAPLLERLCEHSRRWARVALCMPVSQYPALNEKPLNLESLLELELEISHAFVGRPLRAFKLHTFRNAPNLRSLSLPNWHFDPIKSLDIPWHQLLYYSNLSAQGLVDVLRCAQNIVRIRVEGFATCKNSADPLTLPFLRRLYTRGDTTCVFEAASMPALIELTISQTRYTPNCRLLSVLGKSSTVLENINIDYLGEGLISPLLSLLSSCSTLRKLSVTSWSPESMKILLLALTVTEEASFDYRTGMAPMLEMIRFRSCIFPFLHAFVYMVESRWRALREVQFHSSTPIPTGPLRSRLESLHAMGLKILLRN
ncbi:hypothetical protein GYMLUDRAFT_242421 [Collybiopsis luxurians FD-317 M1]|uniref:F-box domain-containing protein n=1 Tax=Collybiopsis luxurians FD-317 M1 TaxID=944289 RepID=A0A0D0D129_9AGAR|nr:hypothetical protein GYMLUDRAFT_242421 [Collybiopsis luxurians FD-317 M1]